MKFPQLNLNSSNNLPNGGKQAGQIIFLKDGKSNTCPLEFFQNQKSSKNRSSQDIAPFRRVICSYVFE